MNAEAVYFSADAGLESVFHNYVAVDSSWIERPIQLARAVIPYRTNTGAGGIGGVAGEGKILLDQANTVAEGRVNGVTFRIKWHEYS
jgi:hypothetical protein